MLFIFDLDHTVIDSSHRQLTLADGSLDLNAWRENCTREKIFADRLLPLANSMRRLISSNRHQVAICTARVLSKHDYDFLQHRGLACEYILSRSEGDNRRDADLKYSKIWNLLVGLKIPRARWQHAVTLVDDNTSVLDMASNRLQINAVDAIKINQELRKNA
jgi:hypothetical protein